MRFRIQPSIFLFLLQALQIGPAHCQSYGINSLASTNVADMEATSINNRGQVAGLYYHDGLSFWSGGWLWLPTADLGLPAGRNFIRPPNVPGYEGEALEFRDINDLGQALGFLFDWPGFGDEESGAHAVLWQTGNLNRLVSGRPGSSQIPGDTRLITINPVEVNNYGLIAGELTLCYRTNLMITCVEDVCFTNYLCDFGQRVPFVSGVAGFYHLLQADSGGEVTGLNDRGQVIGNYNSGSGPRGCLWSDAARVDLADAFQLPGAFPQAINEAGQIAGVTDLSGPRRLFLYLPVADHGLSAGFHYLVTNAVPDAGVIDLNNSGHLLYYLGRTNEVGTVVGRDSFLWLNGSSQPLTNYIRSQAWTRLDPVDINDEGWIAGDGLIDGEFEPFIARPLVLLSVTPDAERLDVGDELTVSVTLESRLDAPLDNVFPLIPLRTDGNAEFEFLGGPTPGEPRTLAPGGTLTFQYALRATNEGWITFTSQVRGSNAVNGRVTSMPVTSARVTVGLQADLLIKRADESNAQFNIDDGYLPGAAGEQIETATVLPGESASFHVLVENDTSRDQRFVLRAKTAGDPGWQHTYTTAGQDITAELTSDSGYTTPLLAAEDWMLIELTLLSPTDAAFGMQTTRLTVQSSLEDVRVLDAVEAQVMISPLRVDVDTFEPVVAEFLTVIARFRNPLPVPLADVRVEIFPSDPFLGGGATRLICLEPIVVPTLPPGEEASFTCNYVITNTGSMRFLAQASAYDPDGALFAADIARSHEVRVGSVILSGASLGQVLLDAPLVQAKPTAVSLTFSNSTSLPKNMVIEIDGDLHPADGNVLPIRLERAVESDQSAIIQQFEFLPNSYGKLRIKVYPVNGSSEVSIAGMDLTHEYVATATRPLNYQFTYLRVELEGGTVAANSEYAAALQESGQSFMNGIFPIVPQAPAGLAFPYDYRFRPGTFSGDTLQNWHFIMARLASTAVRMNLDRLVIVFPDDPRVWSHSPYPNGVVGRAYLYPDLPKNVVAVLDLAAQSGEGQIVTAHEIGHTFGFLDVENPTVKTVTNGIWVETGTYIEEAFDFMDYAEPKESWIHLNHYLKLFFDFSQPRLDPEALILTGSVSSSGEVEADPWFTVTTDQLSEPSENATHEIQMLDDDGTVISRFGFRPATQSLGETLEPAAGNVPRFSTHDPAPFFAVVARPENLAAVRIQEGGRILFERQVSPNAPLGQFLEPSGTVTVSAGETLPVSWSISDADGDALSASLMFSDDAGGRWFPVTDPVGVTRHDWVVPDHPTRRGIFKLQITDGINTTEVLSPEIVIEGSGENHRLIASIRLPFEVQAGTPVQLDGRGSHDTRGDPVGWLWHVTGPNTSAPIELESPSTADPLFTPPVPGLYSVSLVITNLSGERASTFSSLNVTPPPVPRLSARLLDAASIELRWPASEPDLELESNDSLRSSNPWQPVPETPTVSDGQYWLIHPVTSGARFYRLRRP